MELIFLLNYLQLISMISTLKNIEFRESMDLIATAPTSR